MKRFECLLLNELGESYLEKLDTLRKELSEIAESQNLTLLEIAYRCGLCVSTVGNFLQSKTILREPMAMSNRPGRKKFRKPTGPISPKTYKRLRNYVDKKLKKTMA